LRISRLSGSVKPPQIPKRSFRTPQSAQDVKDLETGLNDLGMVAALIKATSADLGGGNATATAVQNIQAQFNATPVAASSDP